MAATLVTLPGVSANAAPRDAVPAAPSGATGLTFPAESGGEIALVRKQSPVPRTAARVRRLPLRLLSFLLVVMAPTAVASAYYFLVAADQYVVEFRFGLRSSEPIRADTGALLAGNAAPLQTVIPTPSRNISVAAPSSTIWARPSICAKCSRPPQRTGRRDCTCR
jgi:hypothetical protein